MVVRVVRLLMIPQGQGQEAVPVGVAIGVGVAPTVMR